MSHNDKLDILIVGAGPAGLCAAIAIPPRPGQRILLCELGNEANKRRCPVDHGGRCQGCGGTCHVVSGFGGCMHAGDGVKFSLMPCARKMGELIGHSQAQQLSDYFFCLLQQRLGRRLRPVGGQIDVEIAAEMERRRLTLRPYPVVVLDEQDVISLLQQTRQHLHTRPDIELRMGCELRDLSTQAAGFVAELSCGERLQRVHTQHVILALGRRGVSQGAQLLQALGLSLRPPSSSLGLRVEMSARWLQAAGQVHPDFKLGRREGPEYKLKTFCFCAGPRGGRLKLTHYQQAFDAALIGLDGHVCVNEGATPGREPGNFALLMQEPEGRRDGRRWLHDLLPRYQRLFGARPVAQRLDRFLAGQDEIQSWHELRDDMPFEPSLVDLHSGSIHRLLHPTSHQRLCAGLRDVVAALVALAPTPPDFARLTREALVVGPELEFLWPQVPIDVNGQTQHEGLYVVGDLAGYGQGLLPALITGLLAARAVETSLSRQRGEA